VTNEEDKAEKIGEKAMSDRRFFGLDSLEWSATLVVSTLISLAAWLI
jgi:hypothetical protein